MPARGGRSWHKLPGPDFPEGGEGAVARLCCLCFRTARCYHHLSTANSNPARPSPSHSVISNYCTGCSLSTLVGRVKPALGGRRAQHHRHRPCLSPILQSTLNTIINFLRRLLGVQLRFIVNGLSGLPLSDCSLALSQKVRNSIFYAFLVKAEMFGWSVIS